MDGLGIFRCSKLAQKEKKDPPCVISVKMFSREDVIEIEMDVDIEGSIPSGDEASLEDFVVSVEPTIKFDHEIVAESLMEEVTADSDETTQSVTQSKYRATGRKAISHEQFAEECKAMVQYFMHGTKPGENARARGRFKEKTSRYMLDEDNIL